MKQFIYLSLIMILALSCRKEDEDKSDYYNPDGSLLTWEQARDLTEDLWSMFDFVVISKDILSPSTRIKQSFADQFEDAYYSPAYNSWLVIMSPNPGTINGFHIYHYVFVNAKTGEIYIDPVEREIDYEAEWIYVKIPQQPTTGPRYPVKSKVLTKSMSSASTNKWAVIISGGASKYTNYYRYWNDCSAMFSILVNNYGYQKSNIYLAISDGTSSDADMNYGMSDLGPFYSSPLDYDGDGQNEQNIYSATKSSIQSLFSTLGQLVGTNDDVFIFVTDHGARINNTSYITLWGTDTLTPSEFNTELDKIHNGNGRINIVMGQCYSGGFVGSITRSNVSIATAAAANELSYARSNAEYDEFLYHWMSAMNGYKIDSEDPINADIDNFSGISFYEAFQYADLADVQYETPQYLSVPDNVGKICTLGDDQITMPSIIGSDDVSSQHGGSFSIQDMPTGASVTWSLGPSLFGSSSSNTLSVLYNGNNLFATSSVSASVSTTYVSFQLIKYIRCWGCGPHEASEWLNGGCGVYQLNLPGGYGFTWGCDSPDWEPLYQGYKYVDFDTSGQDPTSIWCNYYTPLGDSACAFIYYEE